MIKLDIEYCCHDCPYFEPDIIKAQTLDGECTTIIRCESMAKCAYLYKKMREIEAAASIDPDTCE